MLLIYQIITNPINKKKMPEYLNLFSDIVSIILTYFLFLTETWQVKDLL